MILLKYCDSIHNKEQSSLKIQDAKKLINKLEYTQGIMEIIEKSALDHHINRRDKHKIILIQPKTGLDIKHSTIRIPLALLYVAKAMLHEKFEVIFIDQRITQEWKEKLEAELQTDDILCVGIGVIAGKQIKYATEISNIIKSHDATIPIVWGGPHPSLSPQTTIVHPLVDCLVIDDGELTFVNLAKTLQNEGDLHCVDNLVFKQNSEIVMTKKSEKVDVNKFPMPAYELVNIEDYICSQATGGRDLIEGRDFLMVTSRGCTHRCTFCYLTGLHEQSYRAVSPELVIEHIKYLVNEHGINTIKIVEDNFFNYLGRAKKICELLIKEKINVKFMATCRIDYVYHYPMDVLKLIREAGFVELYLGVESGSNRVLEYTKKDITVEQILVANRKLKEAGITPRYSFMIGFPTETKEEMLQTLKLMARLVDENPNAHTTGVQIYMPYPGNPLFDESIKYGYKPLQTLEEYAETHWNKVSTPWLDRETTEFIEKLSYLTYFADGKTSIEYSRPHYFIKKMLDLYTKIVRLRIRHNFYFFTPEIFVLKKYLDY